MAKYLVLYRADPAAMAAMPEPTPEQVEQMTAAWNDWAARAGAGVVDFGAPTAPHSEGADPSVGGYSVLEFDDTATLDALIESHPHKAMGGTIDVFELQPVPGM
jgi:hypothetical protein